MRRNLLAFLAGALIALAVVLIARADGDRTPAASATTTTAPQAATVDPVGLPRAHPRRQRPVTTSVPRTGRATTATPDRASGAAPAPATRGGGGAGAGGASATPPPATNPEPPPTDAAGGDEATGDGGGSATTPSDGGGGGADGAGAVTIPNPATPDASVAQP